MQFSSAGWQPTGSRQNRQHLGCIPTLFAVIRRSFSQKDKESRHHIGCDGASYKCTQWHFLIRISKNKCSSSNSAKKRRSREQSIVSLAWQMFNSKATITAQFFVLILADNVSNALEGDASSLERVRLPCNRRQLQMVDNNYI